MKRIFFNILLLCAFVAAFGVEANAAPSKPKLNFASANYFPTVMDKVIVEAMDRLGYSASIYYMAPSYGFEEANSGRFDGYAQWGPGMEKQYQNLMMVDTGLFQYKIRGCIRLG